MTGRTVVEMEALRAIPRLAHSAELATAELARMAEAAEKLSEAMVELVRAVQEGRISLHTEKLRRWEEETGSITQVLVEQPADSGHLPKPPDDGSGTSDGGTGG